MHRSGTRLVKRANNGKRSVNAKYPQEMLNGPKKGHMHQNKSKRPKKAKNAKICQKEPKGSLDYHKAPIDRPFNCPFCYFSSFLNFLARLVHMSLFANSPVFGLILPVGPFRPDDPEMFM